MLENKRQSNKHNGQNGGSGPEGQSPGRRSNRAIILVMPLVLTLLIFLIRRDDSLTPMHIGIIVMVTVMSAAIVAMIALRMVRHKRTMRAISMASPLIEVPLSVELRHRLSAFAASRQMKPAVAAFDLLDSEIPRFDLEEERDRARRDNEHLRQQAGQGAFLVAVTTEILRRLLLLSGAREEDRRIWRSQISETAARIVSDGLDHRQPFPEQTT
ncbi:MAG: hypothetical protein AB7H86_10155 [Blastocatellales bacterium]